MTTKIKPAKAWAVVDRRGIIHPTRVRATHTQAALYMHMNDLRSDEGWRVIPVIITPAEEEGRRDGTDSD